MASMDTPGAGGMTHAGLLHSWVEARRGVIAERSGSITRDTCEVFREAVEYADRAGLDADGLRAQWNDYCDLFDKEESRMASMTDKQQDTSYNGWTNYPTWCVNLWLSNDEGLYDEALDMARDWTVAESRRFNLADRFKGWVIDDLAPYLGASFAADLLGWALDHVDWHEIADAWIETAADQ